MFAGLAFCQHMGGREVPTADASIDRLPQVQHSSARDFSNAEVNTAMATVLPSVVETRHVRRQTSTPSTCPILGVQMPYSMC